MQHVGYCTLIYVPCNNYTLFTPIPTINKLYIYHTIESKFHGYYTQNEHIYILHAYKLHLYHQYYIGKNTQSLNTVLYVISIGYCPITNHILILERASIETLLKIY